MLLIFGCYQSERQKRQKQIKNSSCLFGLSFKWCSWVLDLLNCCSQSLPEISWLLLYHRSVALLLHQEILKDIWSWGTETFQQNSGVALEIKRGLLASTWEERECMVFTLLPTLMQKSELFFKILASFSFIFELIRTWWDRCCGWCYGLTLLKSKMWQIILDLMYEWWCNRI